MTEPFFIDNHQIFVDFDDCFFLWSVPENQGIRSGKLLPLQMQTMYQRKDNFYQSYGYYNTDLAKQIRDWKTMGNNIYLLTRVPNDIEFEMKRTYMQSIVGRYMDDYFGIGLSESKADFIRCFAETNQIPTKRCILVDNHNSALGECLRKNIHGYNPVTEVYK